MLTLRSPPSLQHNKEREELHRLQAKHGAAFAAKLARRGRDGCERGRTGTRETEFGVAHAIARVLGRDEDDDEDEDEDDEESSSEEEQVDLEVRRRSTRHCVVSFR